MEPSLEVITSTNKAKVADDESTIQLPTLQGSNSNKKQISNSKYCNQYLTSPLIVTVTVTVTRRRSIWLKQHCQAVSEGVSRETTISATPYRPQRVSVKCECDDMSAILFLNIPSLITRLLKSGKWLCSHLTGSSIMVATSWKNVVVKHAASRRRHQTLSVVCRPNDCRPIITPGARSLLNSH